MAELNRIIGQHALFVLILLLNSLVLGAWGANGSTLLIFLGGLLTIFVIGSLYTVFRLLQLDVTLVWMPITIFVLSSALFYGFGPLAFVYGSEGTKTYLALRIIKASPEDLLRATHLSLLGIALVFAGATATMSFFSARLRAWRLEAEISPFTAEALTVLFTSFGLLLKYGVWYPSIWGLLDFTVPGFVALFAALAALGFGLFAFVAFSRGGLLVGLFLSLWLIDFLFTTLNFAKFDLMLAIAFPLAGYFLATRNFVVTVAAVILSLGVYSYSQPMVTYARYAGVSEYSSSGYADRAATIYHYVTERPDILTNANYLGSQRWWTRFEYSAKQAFAMNLRDQGISTSSLAQLPTLFIPRVIWPNKPELRSPGQDFYFLVTGRTTTRMSISVYADLYWQFGWVGVILVCPLVGVGLVLMTNKLIPHIQARDFAYLPLVLIGVRYALVDPNKFVINGVLSTAAFFIVYALMINFAVKVVNDRGGLGRGARPSESN